MPPPAVAAEPGIPTQPTPLPSPTPQLTPALFAPLILKMTQSHYQLFVPVVLQAAQLTVPVVHEPLPFDPTLTTVRLVPVVEGLSEPTRVTGAGDGSGRLFVTERKGQIRVLRAGVLTPRAFLDLSVLIQTEGPEQGLLDIAFHPDYTHTGLFYVAYTDADNALVVARYRVSSDPDAADPSSSLILLRIPKPTEYHNGGHLVFGPDGYLYIGVGDGGIQGDPDRNAQSPRVLLGKILRIDVNAGSPYAIPPDNPFVNRAPYRPEIWALGLRNPWRFAFDPKTGDLYIGDVGQERYEEIDFQPYTSRGGENYGWNEMEGLHCYQPGCDPTLYVLPIAEYEHDSVCNAIIGGEVYRGEAEPALYGGYFFADACSGRLWSLTRTPAGAWTTTMLIERSPVISSFGTDDEGEVYVTALDVGGLYRLAAQPR
ncbi:MAG: PQQ-dependent sugar dehydrogenase [Anaerolineae bacterium]|nr:PQQ-dependent sugar dehydrogenase [Anaerolineae bacterium]